ncbi:hypothetical protein BGZ46_009435 [Entomortierella lignicola]|nr:hypothetical protein BGZ46_009435 [Entomortierella lignicola]
MNALIALAVWCQPHGPVTILTTQHRRPTSSSSSTTSSSSSSSLSNGNSIIKEGSNVSGQSPLPPSEHQNKALSQQGSCLSDTPASITSGTLTSTIAQTSPDAQSTAETTTFSSGTATSSITSNSNSQSLEPKKSRRSIHQASPGTSHSPIGNRPASAHPALSTSTSNNSCECQFSIPSGEKSLHSVDPLNSEISYISQPVPVDASLFAPIRIACIRSLNSETYCGREGSVFFGDGVNGYVLSYMFTVYDAQSRGHRVKYTIMTMMTDRVFLVASMEYLISQFQVIASNLQSMANTQCPPQQSPATRSLSFSSSHHRGSIMPENAPTKRGRPLTDVLAKPDIFVQLHAAFVSVLSNCSRRLTERHIQGRPTNECISQGQNEDQQQFGTENHQFTVNPLWELRRVLGRQQFNRLVWNSVVGNQVIVRGDDSSVVNEIISSLEEILPKDCCTIIMNGSSYEPSYACNILGLDRSIPIPPDLDPQDFILLDVCIKTLDHQTLSPPLSLPANSPKKNGSATELPIYQADWSSATLVADMTEISSRIEKTTLESGGPLANSPNTTQRQNYLLQAGEEPPELLQLDSGNMNGKSIQFHNLYKTGKASDEGVVDGFLQSMKVDKRDLKILRFFTRCAKSSSFQSQKYRSEIPGLSDIIVE